MFRNGQTAFVNSNTNFVLVNQGRGTVQVAFNTVYPGPNGIGGVTVDGTTSDMKITTDKKGNVNCQFSIQGIGIYNIYISTPLQRCLLGIICSGVFCDKYESADSSP